ncbi:MAG: cupredoxin domain-containing protein [Proteobacteria bacterium]|nr:cupredoxin domain-containing protein [Pseudomonadota bacterium]
MKLDVPRLPRRVALKIGAGLLLDAAAAAAFVSLRAHADEGRVIPVEARRFKYTPSEIRLKKGETVTLAFTAIDFVHGFSAPDFGVRSDLLPGRITNVTITAKAPGRYTFLCDNFCGDHHEDMNGTFIVE